MRTSVTTFFCLALTAAIGASLFSPQQHTAAFELTPSTESDQSSPFKNRVLVLAMDGEPFIGPLEGVTVRMVGSQTFLVLANLPLQQGTRPNAVNNPKIAPRSILIPVTKVSVIREFDDVTAAREFLRGVDETTTESFAP